MKCDYYFKFEAEQISKNLFNEHIKDCRFCRERYEQNRKLMNLASSLKQPVGTSDLWTPIEKELIKNVRKSGRKVTGLSGYRTTILRIAAVMIVGVSTGYYLLFHENVPEKGILKAGTLEKVTKAEQNYDQAITQLEQLVQAELDQFDIELQLLYRDKIETIDRQILACKEALESNPANAHIRRYLFMAMQEKKQTLVEILSAQTGKFKKES